MSVPAVDELRFVAVSQDDARAATGDRQPEAEGLYLSLGYTRLDEPLSAEREVYPVAFLKEVP